VCARLAACPLCLFSLLLTAVASSRVIPHAQAAKLHSKLQEEGVERVNADEQLVQAINHYGGALQAGIKIVATH